MARIAFLGLGAMGRRMATRLVAAGHDLTVHNRHLQAAMPLAMGNCRIAADARSAVAEAEIVIAMLRDDSAAEAIWLDDENGVAHHLPPDSIAVDCSTLSIACVDRLDGAFAALGRDFVAAPVLGSTPQAEAGTLIQLIGRDSRHADRLGPVLAAIGSTQIRLGSNRRAAAAKLAVNALFATQAAALAEAIDLLQRHGLDRSEAAGLLFDLPVTSPALRGLLSLITADDHAPRFPIGLVAKDLGYAAAARDRSQGVIAAARDLFCKADAAGGGAANISAVVDYA